MSTDLRDLLRGAAVQAPPPDPDEVWRAGRRRARRRTAVAGTSITVMVLAVVALGTTMRPERVAISPAAPSSAPTTATSSPTATPREAATGPATAEASEPRNLDAMAAEGTIGLQMARQAPAEEFHPAMLVGPGQYAWYMTQVGWTERIPTGSQRQAAMCAWADDLGMGTDGFAEALNDATIRRYSPVLGSDGLPVVVEDVCTSGASGLWEHGGPPPGDCTMFAEAKHPSQQAVEDCRRHHGQGS